MSTPEAKLELFDTIGVYRPGTTGTFDFTIIDEERSSSNPYGLAIDQSRIRNMTIALRSERDHSYRNGRDPATTDNPGKYAIITSGGAVNSQANVEVSSTGGGCRWTITKEDLAFVTGEEDLAWHELVATIAVEYDTNPARHLEVEHRLVVVQRPGICLVQDVVNAMGGLPKSDASLATAIELAILHWTDRFEDIADRNLLRARRQEVYSVHDENTRHLRLKSYPIEEIHQWSYDALGHPETVSVNGTLTDLGWLSEADEGLVTYQPAAWPAIGDNVLWFDYTGGYRSTGAMPRHWRRAAARQVAYEVRNSPNIGVLSKSVAGGAGGNLSLERLSGDMLPEFKKMAEDARAKF